MKPSRNVLYRIRKRRADSQVIEVFKKLALKYPRYGFKLLFAKSRQMGHKWNHKKVHRIYKLLGLNLRIKPRKRLPRRVQNTLQIADKHSEYWAVDFMSDASTRGEKFRTLNVLDEYNRECLAIKVEYSIKGSKVVETLEQLADMKGYPKQIRLDNGPEFISNDMKEWAKNKHVKLVYIQPGKPAQDAYIERFNKTYRSEILNPNLFNNLEEVRALTEEWLIE